jgi:hypothetical protein
LDRDNLISISKFERIDTGIAEVSKRAGEFSPTMADPPKATRTILKNIPQSDPNLPSTNSRSSDEIFDLNNNSGMKSNYNFL